MTTSDNFVLYHYSPSLPLALLFTILFLLLTALHTAQLLRTRTYFLLPFCLGGLFESLGYIGRIISSREPYGQWSLGSYVMQAILILVAPALFAASVYMTLGRIVRVTRGERYVVLVGPKWLTRVFVVGDVLSFFVQGGGMFLSFLFWNTLFSPFRCLRLRSRSLVRPRLPLSPSATPIPVHFTTSVISFR